MCSRVTNVDPDTRSPKRGRPMSPSAAKSNSYVYTGTILR